MTPTTNVDVQSLIDTAVRLAVNAQKVEQDKKIEELTRKLSELDSLKPPVVETYEPIRIIRGIMCDESLDVVKTLPEFHGDVQQYVS